MNDAYKDLCKRDVQKRVDCTYSHIHSRVDILIEKGLVVQEKKGRKQFLTLTERGLELVEGLKDINFLRV